MKVLHVIASLSSGGAEKLLVDLVSKMKGNKIEVEVEVEVLVLSPKNNFFGDILKERNIKVYYSKANKIYSLENIFFLIKTIKSNKFDIIHTHLYSAQLFSVIANIANFNRIPLITTEHSTNNNRRNKIVFKLLDKWMYSKYRKIIAITPDVEDSLKQYLPQTSQKIHLVHNGIDLDLYKKASPIERKELIPLASDNEIWVLMVAGMRAAKDQETLIRASKSLPLNYRVIFVGEGERMEQVQQYALQQGSENITFLGARNDVPNILKASDIFVLSSHWEGFGLVLVEAAASGIPVIASDVPGMNKVANAVNGYLFPSGNEKALMSLVKQNKEEMKVANSNKLDDFSINKTVMEYNEIYKKLLS